MGCNSYKRNYFLKDTTYISSKLIPQDVTYFRIKYWVKIGNIQYYLCKPLHLVFNLDTCGLSEC